MRNLISTNAYKKIDLSLSQCFSSLIASSIQQQFFWHIQQQFFWHCNIIAGAEDF